MLEFNSQVQIITMVKVRIMSSIRMSLSMAATTSKKNKVLQDSEVVKLKGSYILISLT